jgi:hypothetical protein
MPFIDYIGTPFAQFILPIIPKGVQLTPGSDILPESLGKIPGWRGPNGWYGIDWPKFRATEKNLRSFGGWYADRPAETIGINSRELLGIDADFENAKGAEIIRECAYEKLGFFPPVRTRPNSEKILLGYRLDFKATTRRVTKVRRVFVDASGKRHALEVLGDGQQWLMEGEHPSDVLYAWEGGARPVDLGWEKITAVTADDIDAFVREATERLIAAGFTLIKGSMGRMGGASNEVSRIGPEHPEVCPDFDELKKLLQLLPGDHAEFEDYDDWEKALRALKTALGGDEELYNEVFLPWALPGHPDNNAEMIRSKWESFSDSGLGWGYLCSIGHDYGYYGDVQGLFGNLDEDGAQSSGSPDLPQDRGRLRGPVPKLMPPDFALHNLPTRPYVLGHRFMAGVVTLGVGAPGAGKSNLAILTALSIATSRPLTGEEVRRPGRIWVHNNEDSRDELYRRIGGMLQCHQIGYDSVRENVFVSSGLDERLVVAVKDKDIVKRTIAVAEVIASIKQHGIVHIVIDPLISTHRGVSENSNDEIEQVIETIQHIAHETGCSIDLVHHALKSHSHNTEVHAGDMNAARGASSLIGAARMVYTLSPMSKDTAEKMNLHPTQAARLVRLDIGKGNYAARDTNIRWFELEPFDIGNGDSGEIFCESDSIAVPKPWAQPMAHEQPASKDDERAVTRAAKLQRVRDVVAAAMPSERCEISKVRASIEHEFAIKKSAAHDLIKAAIPEGEEVTAEGGGRSCVLTMERQEPSPPGRLYIARKPSEQYSEAA